LARDVVDQRVEIKAHSHAHRRSIPLESGSSEIDAVERDAARERCPRICYPLVFRYLLY